MLAEHEAAGPNAGASALQIIGDGAAEQALWFAIYHLNGVVNPAHERVSIRALH